jgi:hypothetical protein
MPRVPPVVIHNSSPSGLAIFKGLVDKAKFLGSDLILNVALVQATLLIAALQALLLTLILKIKGFPVQKMRPYSPACRLNPPVRLIPGYQTHSTKKPDKMNYQAYGSSGWARSGRPTANEPVINSQYSTKKSLIK